MRVVANEPLKGLEQTRNAEPEIGPEKFLMDKLSDCGIRIGYDLSP